MYAFWVAIGVSVICILLWRSASARRAQITKYRKEEELEGWKEAHAARRGAPDYRGQTTLIGQAIGYDYPAPAESWGQTTPGMLILGLIVALVSGLILLWVEYSHFDRANNTVRASGRIQVVLKGD